MTRSKFYFIGFISIIAIPLFWSCGTKLSRQSGSPESKAVKLDSLFTFLYEQKLFNGAAAVLDEGKLIFEKSYGLANLEQKTAFNSKTSMEVASVSKQFTAAAIMHLYQKGQLDLDDDIRKYLPREFPYEDVKIKHLLSHTGGLPDYTGYFIENWPEDKIANNKDILRYFIKHQPDIIFRPGTDYSYSNTGYVLLAEIIETASGLTIDRYLEEHLFLPFGFKHAGFYQRSEIYSLDDYAPSYMWSLDSCAYIRPENLPGKAYYNFLSNRLGPGRLSLSVEDLLRWDKLLYSEDFLTEDSKNQMFTPVGFAGVDTDYGFGFHNYNDSIAGAVSYHTGSWAGNLSYIKRFRDSHSTIVLLNNTHSPYMKNIRAAVDAIVLGRDPKPILPELIDQYHKLSCDPDFDEERFFSNVNSENYSFTKEDLKEIRLIN